MIIWRRALALVAATGLMGAACVVDSRTTDNRREEPSMHVSARAVRLLGRDAQALLAPGADTLNALVEVHDARDIERMGLQSVAPGIGSFRGDAATLLALADSPRTKLLELSPRLHLLNDRTGVTIRSRVAHVAGVTGAGTLIGIADTGIDVAHPDFRYANGKTRVRWLLDFSQPVRGVHSAAEADVKIVSGGKELGAVWSGADLDSLVASGRDGLPRDPDGHGTHVAGIAAGNGGLGELAGLAAGETGPYVGVAPGAEYVIVRLPTFDGGGIEVDNVVRAVKFIFGRGDLEQKPTVVNLSLGTDFGAHDGSTLWERAITSYVGVDKPGRALIAAAGNSGSVGDVAVHESVNVSPYARMRIPVVVPPVKRDGTLGNATDGRVQIWLNMRPGAAVEVGLDGPNGEWIAPQGENAQRGYTGQGATAGVVVGQVPGGPVAVGSQSAFVFWGGAVAAGTYYVTLKGTGNVDLYVEGGGDFGVGAAAPHFLAGVREGTVNLPGTNAAVITVGCTVGRARWKAITGLQLGPVKPELDLVGGLATNTFVPNVANEVCFFSSAGPNSLGVAKPDIAAPGGGIISTMSAAATPGRPLSIFTTDKCPKLADGKTDNRCLQIDQRHAVTSGTSMSSPAVAGVVALLMQRNPQLNQEQIRAALQGGAQRFRGAAPFAEQSGPGEVDAVGALIALDRLEQRSPLAPDRTGSWLAPSSDYVQADGGMPLTVLALLRAADGSAADVSDVTKLRVSTKTNGTEVAANVSAVSRRGPGVYVFTLRAPAFAGGSQLDIQLLEGDTPLAPTRRVAVAADGWRARYVSRATGACSVSADVKAKQAPARLVMLSFAGVCVLGLARRRRVAYPKQSLRC
jgi:subtilisin family serine protease